MFQATRRRLAIWYTTVTAILLLLFATTVSVYVRTTLIDRVDDTLKHVVEVIERSIEAVEPKPFQFDIATSFHNNARSLEEDRIELEWFDPNGQLLWSTLSEPLGVPLNTSCTPQTVYLPSKLSPESRPVLRQITKLLKVDRKPIGYLRVSHPWFEISKPSRDFAIDLGFGFVVMVISVAAIGWWLSGLAMNPVRESYQHLKQFTADASHELRSPIASIQTNVQVALDDPEFGEGSCHQQLQIVERLTRRLGRLVDDLLFLTRQDSGMVQSQKQTVSLDAILIESIEEQEAIAREQGIQLILDIVEPSSQLDDSFSLLGDWDQLVRLFANLVGNAIQYTLKGGTVTVTLQYVKHKVGSALQVRVVDTGIGISAEALPHVFDRFYRVDPARSRNVAHPTGSGLGLSIARAIVRNHGGEIQLESEIDRGTKVTVCFPISG
ncbi:MAG: HAMP domain-containing histidine kinase [Cyanobacteria bacterium SID2]|nr:HAMP domain-containing histidine kinase [Cyanobacteria bacterium SID2]MBP0002875.1 HAMP domain-containing histidine kinase [Cyanobacteria bacterium SBC]